MEKERSKCPICGKFCSSEAAERYARVIRELDDVTVDLGKSRQALSDAKELTDAAVKRSEDYEALYIETRGKCDRAEAEVKMLHEKLASSGLKLVSMQSELNEAHTEIDRLRSRGFWSRVFNK